VGKKIKEKSEAAALRAMLEYTVEVPKDWEDQWDNDRTAGLNNSRKPQPNKYAIKNKGVAEAGLGQREEFENLNVVNANSHALLILPLLGYFEDKFLAFAFAP
ncbi:hypothetical protein DSO57_1029356, partial [Entomophthora muscae]